jgi:hypothetical protein
MIDGNQADSLRQFSAKKLQSIAHAKEWLTGEWLIG